ncbi:MAG: hypothetical protein KDD60_08385, partial [Bdellovibrionales bacterium]|nr:hypothetical protein [Bdellovibrionales bacterium]
EHDGEKVSGSRIAVMTGVHRKDVARFQRAVPKEKPKNIIAKIMVQWQHSPQFTTKNGRPRVLEAVGRESEFAKLVESVNGGNISSYSILNEMERMGIVQRTGKRIKLQWRDYVPPMAEEEALALLATDTGNLFQAVEENVYERQETPHLHLTTVFDRISEAALPQIRSWLVEEGSMFQKKVRSYLSSFDADLNPEIEAGTAYGRVSVGSFSFSEVQKK